jgi:hypothetical protein
MQTSNYSKASLFHIKPKTMPLSYLHGNCRKQAVTPIWESRRFESMYTHRGKPDQHATRFPRSVRVWSRTIHISRGPNIATLHLVINRVELGHWSREKGLPTQSTARWLTNPWVHTQFLSRANQWSSGGKVKHLLMAATRLTGPINTSMWSVRSTLAHGGQLISP